MYGSCAGESVLAEGLRHWKCVPDGAEVRGGMSRVIPVRSAQGAALMLKAIPPQSARLEMRGLRAFPPAASVRCIDHLDDLGLLLLERLTPESLIGRPVDTQITIQAGLARALAVPDPGGIPSLADGLADHLGKLVMRAPGLLKERVITAAADTAHLLADRPEPTLTHGDLHAANVHRDVNGMWRALDPTPQVGTIAHEGHTIVVERSRLGDLIADGGGRELRRRPDVFADVADVEPDLVVAVCQMRATLSALHEAGKGNRELASQLQWMAVTLT